MPAKAFTMTKNGKEVSVQPPHTREFRPTIIHEPLDPARVVGVDTESFKWDGVLTTVLIPIHTIDEAVPLDLEQGDSPIVKLFAWLLGRYGVREERPSRTRQRSKESRAQREGSADGRDGRRESVEPLILVWYNAEYDLGRLMERELTLLRSVAVGDDSLEIPVGPFLLEIVFMCPTGSAPSFEWYIRDRERKLVCRLIGRDMWGYWKAGLDRTAKALADLGVTTKIKLDDGAEGFKRDWGQMTEAEKDEVRIYALGDSKSTREVYLATVQLLMAVDPRVIRKDGTIPASAPGAAAKIAFQMAFDPDDLELWYRPPYYASQLGLDAYAGGRVFCRRPGPVERLAVLDITSAYPDAMRWLPDPARCRYRRVRPGRYDQERYKGKWGVLVISGEGLDPEIPALREHDTANKRLKYIYGQFDQVAATIPEIVIGVASGRLRVDRIHNGAIMEGPVESSFLRAYVDKVFQIKEDSERDSPMYQLAKLLINALYGKLIEVREVNYAPLGFDGLYLFPNLEQLDDPAFVQTLRDGYILGGLDFLEEFRGALKAFPRRSGPSEIPLRQILTSKEFAAGHYFLPLHAAQVTGFVSAKLGLAAWATGALQGDTDSIFTENPEGLAEYYRLMDEAGYPAPRDGLGSFGLEVKSASGYLVKTKMYSLVTAGGKWKQAHHGVIKLLPKVGKQHPEKWQRASAKIRREIEHRELHRIMGQLVTVGSSKYDTRPRPVRMRQAMRSGATMGEFRSELRSIKLLADPNMRVAADGFMVWKSAEEIQMDRLAVVAEWERQRELRAQPDYSKRFRAAWLREVGRVLSYDVDPGDIPSWCRGARTSTKARALDTLTAGSAVPDTAGQLEHPLAVMGYLFPGWVETEAELLAVLHMHAPVHK